MISARVRKALRSQTDLRAGRERCSAALDRLAAIGCDAGRQLRITRTAGEYALYTASEVRDEAPDGVVRMGLAARERLGGGDAFDVILDAQVPHPTLTAEEAELQGELVERLDEDGEASALAVLAPHGGDIERFTDLQSERMWSLLAEKGASTWRCKGWKPGGGAFERWHITSTDLHEASFPLLGELFPRGFAHAVAFHGFGEAEILIGGTAPRTLKKKLEAAIEDAVRGSGIPVRIARPDERYGGDDPRNVVNRLCGQNGVQLEQSPEARDGYWQAIADAVASVYDGYL